MAGKAFNFKLGGETSFLSGGLPSTLAGQCFSGVITEGCFYLEFESFKVAKYS